MIILAVERLHECKSNIKAEILTKNCVTSNIRVEVLTKICVSFFHFPLLCKALGFPFNHLTKLLIMVMTMMIIMMMIMISDHYQYLIEFVLWISCRNSSVNIFKTKITLAKPLQAG